MIRKIVSLWLCAMIVGSTVMAFVNVEGKDVVKDELAYIVSTPFRINSNAEFTTSPKVTDGDGSSGNPWIIENYDIDGAGYGYCIYIGNTTDHFELRNSYLHGASGINTLPYYPDSGVILYMVQNGTITNNTASSNNYGITLYTSSNNNIANNTVSNENIGIYLVYSSSNNTLVSNAASSNIFYGIYLCYSCNYNTIVSNTASSNGFYGIYLDTSSSYNIIDSNTASSNTDYGILLFVTCNYNTVTNNMVSLNGAGILVRSSSNYNTITDNNALNNNNGIYIDSSDSNTIYHNNIISNLQQAYDNTGTNVWNATYPSGGNYWSDWTTPDVYSGPSQNIAGTDGIVDNQRAIAGGSNYDRYPWRSENGWLGAPVENLQTGETFWTIQAAIDDSDTLNSHTITMAAGTYYEHVTVNKQLTLVGAGRDVTIIDGSGSGTVVTITMDWVNIAGFTARNSGSGYDGIYLNNSVHCRIENNSASSNRYGIYLDTSCDYNTIANNTALNNDIGILLAHSCCNNTIVSNTASSNGYYGIDLVYSCCNNTLVSNTASSNGYYGIYLDTSSNYNIIDSNTASSNTNYGILLFVTCNYNTVANNTVSLNDAGILVRSSSNYNTITDNNALNNNHGIYIDSSDSNTIYHNNIISNLQQAFDNTGTNVWSAAYPAGGNYWSDWTAPDVYCGPSQNIPGADGIVDNQRAIAGGSNYDRYPWTTLNGWYTLPVGLVKNVNTGEEFWTIQAAIDATNTLDGHTIAVAAGTFAENVVVNKSLAIIGSGPANTTIDSSGTTFPAVSIEAPDVEISGFNITNDVDFHGIDVSEGGFNIHGNEFTTVGDAVYVNIRKDGMGSAVLGDMSITDNVVTGEKGITIWQIFFDTPVAWSNITVGNLTIADNVIDISTGHGINIGWNAVGSLDNGTVAWGDTVITGNQVTSPLGIVFYGSMYDLTDTVLSLGNLVFSDNVIVSDSAEGFFIDWWDITDMHGTSSVTVGLTEINNNSVESFSDGIYILFDWLDNYQDTSSIEIGGFEIIGNDFTSGGSGIFFDGSGLDVFSSMAPGTYATMGTLIMSENTVNASEYGIYLDLYFFETALQDFGGITMSDNFIISGLDGINVENLVIELPNPNTDISVGDTVITGNHVETLQTGTYGIDLSLYALYSMLGGSMTWGDIVISDNNNTIIAPHGINFWGDLWNLTDVTATFGDIHASNNRITSNESDAIYIDWWDIYNIHGTATITFGQTHTDGNVIESNGHGIYFLFDWIQDLYDSTTIDIGDFYMDDNQINAPAWGGVVFDAVAFDNMDPGVIANMGSVNVNGNTITADVGIAIFADFGDLAPSDSEPSMVSRNVVSNGSFGIGILACQNATIKENVISNFSVCGIDVEFGYGNLIYHNQFLNNALQAYDIGTETRWNAPYPLGGNYWSDYSGTDMFSGVDQLMPGADGFGDTPYTAIDSSTGSQDNYPLTEPFGSPSDGLVMITSHEDGQLVEGTILVEAVVTGMNIAGVNFYVNGILRGFDGTNNYQFILDTTTMLEDTPFTLTAEAVFVLSPPVNTTLNLVPNNNVDAGNYISANTQESEYSPDEVVSVQIDIINAPPVFNNLDITAGFEGPTGYTQYSATYNLPVDDLYQITIALPSDAALGTYNVTAMANGYVGDVLVWTANDTAQFDVVGQSVQDQLGDLNQTVSNMNGTLIGMNISLNEIALTMNNMNITLTAISGDIAAMNSSLAAMMNGLDAQLEAVNTSLHASLAQLENDFLAELASVNASLSADIQNMMAGITADLAGMNSSLGGRLILLEGNLSGNISDLNDWLDLMLHEMDANLTTTNQTLHQHMTDLEALTTEFYNNLTADLLGVMGQLFALEANLTLQHNALNSSIALLADAVDAQHNLTRTQILDRLNQTYGLLDSLDGNLTTHDSDIQALLAALDALVQNQGNMTRDQLVANTTQILADVATVQSDITTHDTAIRQNMTTLSNLMVTLDQNSLTVVNYIVSELAQNLSAHDTGISDDLIGISDDIGNFRDITDEQLQVINTTLENLVKLDGIITDLEELDQALQDAEAQLSANMEAASDSQMFKIDLNTILLIIVLVLALVSIVIGLKNRGSVKTQKSERATEPKLKPEDEKSEEIGETTSE